LNIWLISKYAGLPKYGLGSKLFFLAREFVRNGHNALLITSDANHLAEFPKTDERYNHEDVDGITVRWIKTRKYRETASAGRVLSWVDFEQALFRMPRKSLPRPEVVIISSLSLLSVVYGYYLKRVYGAILVFEVRDIWPLTMVAEGGFSRWHPLVLILGMIEKYGYRKADLVVGTMPRLDLHVREAIGYDRPFHCSPLGYAPEWITDETPLPEEFLRQYFPEGKFIVGYAGSIGITNALEPFMECIERLSGRVDIHFVLVGSGDLKNAYMARLSGHTNVSFVPRIEKAAVPSFLRRCDVLYLAAHDSPVWRFGQSLNKLMDYMLSGKPVIASYSGYQSMLNEARCGVFVDANDALALTEVVVRFVEMPAQGRQQMGQKGRNWVLANRSYEVLGKEYLAVLEEQTRTRG